MKTVVTLVRKYYKEVEVIVDNSLLEGKNEITLADLIKEKKKYHNICDGYLDICNDALINLCQNTPYLIFDDGKIIKQNEYKSIRIKIHKLNKETFFKTFDISEEYFTSTGLDWDNLNKIYADYCKIVPLLEKEAERIISLLPQMIPGKQRGKPVKVPYAVPIVFKFMAS